MGVLLVSLGTLFLTHHINGLHYSASLFSILLRGQLTRFTLPHLFLECDLRPKKNLDSGLLSFLRSVSHHADCVVVLSGPHLCVNLCVAVLPAQLASYRQKRAKGDASGETKKTQKRKGPAVSQIQSATAQDAELNSKANHEVHHRSRPPLQRLKSGRLCVNAVLDISRAEHLI